jgi:peptidoglycan/xylan/chitin deacetylase (PgdA/CDA1 family)
MSNMLRQALYGNRREVALPPNFVWPDGKRIAVLVGACFEGWSDDKWPGLGPMGNPLPANVPDINAIRWAEYGGRRGMPRILRILARRNVRATVFVNGVIAERFPTVVRAIAEAGHDIAAHSSAQEIVPALLDEVAEIANIQKSLEAIKVACGVTARGWASPRGTPSVRSEKLLAEAGLEWHADTLDDDLPYLLQFDNGSLVAIPVTMEVNDLPLHLKNGHPPYQMVKVFEDTLKSLRQLGETGKIEVIIHAHVFGRPAGIWAYEEIIRIAQESTDVWLTNWSEVSSHAKKVFIKNALTGEMANGLKNQHMGGNR